jgi:hypothetical protein
LNFSALFPLAGVHSHTDSKVPSGMVPSVLYLTPKSNRLGTAVFRLFGSMKNHREVAESTAVPKPI